MSDLLTTTRRDYQYREVYLSRFESVVKNRDFKAFSGLKKLWEGFGSLDRTILQNEKLTPDDAAMLLAYS